MEEITMTPPEENFKNRNSLLLGGGILLLLAALATAFYWYDSSRSGGDLESQDLMRPGELPLTDKRTVETLDTGPVLRSDGKTEAEISGDRADESLQPDATPGLPQLDQSDDFVRSLMSVLSPRPEFDRWIGIDHLVQKFVLLTDNLSRGAVPYRYFKNLSPSSKFLAVDRGGQGYRIDPRGYQRYNVYADTVASIDVDAALHAYSRLKPLLDRGYQELGYPAGDFDSALRQAITQLLAAPVLGQEVALVRPSVMYRFADAELESLSAAQKQLIRMGPRNTKIIQSSLRRFLAGLDQQ